MLLKFKKIIFWILQRIPFVRSLVSFPKDALKKAFTELFVLWVISSTPLFLSVFIEVMSGDAVKNAALKEINIKSAFLYSSAFLAPMLYTLVARLIYPRKEDIFKGAVEILVLTFLLLIFSSYAFQNEKTQNFSNGYSLIVYSLSLYCWFLSIADNHNKIDYSAEASNQENSFSDKASSFRGN